MPHPGRGASTRTADGLLTTCVLNPFDENHVRGAPHTRLHSRQVSMQSTAGEPLRTKALGRQVYFYLWEHHVALLHGMVAEYIGRAVKAGMPDARQDHVYQKQLVRTHAAHTACMLVSRPDMTCCC